MLKVLSMLLLAALAALEALGVKCKMQNYFFLSKPPIFPIFLKVSKFPINFPNYLIISQNTPPRKIGEGIVSAIVRLLLQMYAFFCKNQTKSTKK